MGYNAGMENLFPASDTAPANVDAYDFYRPADPQAPWLRINMVSTVDGRVTDETGRAGGLGGEADLAAFRAQRALADAVLVGAGTARVEGYGPHVVDRSVKDRRRADGRDHPAPIVLVSESLALDTSSRLFTEAVTRTIVLTCAFSPADRREQLQEVADVIVLGREHVDLRAGVAALRARGHPHIVCEGGPMLNAALLQSGLADELCLTLAPRVLGGKGLRLVHSAGEHVDTRLHLSAIGREGEELFFRYRVLPSA